MQLTWWRYPDEHPDYDEQTNLLHGRCALRVLRLCQANKVHPFPNARVW